MGKVLKAILNNLNENTYIKNKRFLKLQEKGTKAPVIYPKDSREWQTIEHCETSVRHNNLKVYLKNMIKLRSKQATIIGIPLLLGGLTIHSWNLSKESIKSTEVYKKHEIVFDEEKVISDTYDDVLYAYALPFYRDYTDENIENVMNRTGTAEFYFGEGENAYHASFNISDSGEWTNFSYSNEPWYNLDDKDDNSIRELDEVYSLIIDEVAAKLKDNLSKDKAAIIDEILTNNKNDILVKISQYESIGNMDLEFTKKYWLFKIIMIIIDIITVGIFIYYYEDLTEVSELDIQNDNLNESYKSMKLRYAALKYKEAFLEAESIRINMINDVLDKCANDKSILTEYEKKLVITKK